MHAHKGDVVVCVRIDGVIKSSRDAKSLFPLRSPWISPCTGRGSVGLVAKKRRVCDGDTSNATQFARQALIAVESLVYGPARVPHVRNAVARECSAALRPASQASRPPSGSWRRRCSWVPAVVQAAAVPREVARG